MTSFAHCKQRRYHRHLALSLLPIPAHGPALGGVCDDDTQTGRPQPTHQRPHGDKTAKERSKCGRMKTTKTTVRST
jgi:hypothetical protein